MSHFKWRYRFNFSDTRFNIFFKIRNAFWVSLEFVRCNGGFLFDAHVQYDSEYHIFISIDYCYWNYC